MRTKKTESEYQTCSINTVKAWAYPPNQRKEGETNGALRVVYSSKGRWGDDEIAEFPLVSCWLDPNKATALRICKAHALVPKTPANKKEENAIKVAEYMLAQSGERKIQQYSSPRMSLSVDDFDNIVRYGCDETPYRSDGHDYSKIPVFDSKSEAINSILEAIKSYSIAAIAGIDLINLNAISDQVLLEMGFLKSVDQMGVSVPMWCGDATSIMSLGRRSYGYSSYSQERSGSSATQAEVVESFLDLIEMDLAMEAV